MLRLELFVRDVQESLGFYTDVLGFTERYDGGSGTYRPLERGAVRVSLQDIATLPSDHPLVAHEHLGAGVEIVLEVEDVDAFFEDVRLRWPIASELADQPWGLRDFRVLDPDGYYWRATGT